MWIETQRLILREFQPTDAWELAPILADPKVMKFSPNGVLSISQTQDKIKNFIASYQKFGYGKWAVIDKETNVLMGYCGIAVEQVDGKDECEIGYRLNSQFWGRGLATEAAIIAIQSGFEQFKIPYILGLVERENLASVRILAKLGMRYVKETIFYGIKMDVYQCDAKVQTTRDVLEEKG